jgi:hypothetical protein
VLEQTRTKKDQAEPSAMQQLSNELDFINKLSQNQDESSNSSDSEGIMQMYATAMTNQGA